MEEYATASRLDRLRGLEDNMPRGFARRLLVVAGYAVALWAVLAGVVFAFRHPWATDTQRLTHIVDALLFRSVPHQILRESIVSEENGTSRPSH